MWPESRISTLPSYHIATYTFTHGQARGTLPFGLLDFKAGSQSYADVADSIVPSQYQAYVGKYQGPEKAFIVLVQNKKLAVDIPDRMIFELRDPDEQGRWYFVISPDLYIIFAENDFHKVAGMKLFNQPQIPKQKQEEQELRSVPEEFRPFCGIYPIPGQGDITVFYRNKHLSIILPPNHTFDLEGPDEEGMWNLKNESDQISFVKDEEGIVRALIIYEIINLKKID